MRKYLTLLGGFLIVFLVGVTSNGQSILDRPISISVKKKSVADVLEQIGKQCNVSFSYSSTILPKDSLVALSVSNKPLGKTLELILGDLYQFKVTDRYIIIQRAEPREKYTFITGYIRDSETNQWLEDASVYQQQQFVATLTNHQGYFRLKLREQQPLQLSISKLGYADTSLLIKPNQPVEVSLAPKALELDPLIISKDSHRKRTWLERFFISSRLQAQRLNLSKFFVALPVQISLTPGLSTHGKLSSQAINKYSLNIIGGYSAGINGLEMAGVFNINSRDCQYVQIAGVFNSVGGKFSGVQISGVHNTLQDSLYGVQAAGFGNKVLGAVQGVQLAGLYNLTSKPIKGAQVSGVINRAPSLKKGIQIAGIANVIKGTLEGVQVGGIINRAGYVKGLQVGLINFADSSSGHSFGLLNFVKKGKAEIAVYSNELAPFNIAWKTGTHKWYSILMAGGSSGSAVPKYLLGLGFGKELPVSSRVNLMGEITSQNSILRNGKSAFSLYRFQLGASMRIMNHISCFLGPAFTYSFRIDPDTESSSPAQPGKNYPGFHLSDRSRGWLGWQAGINWNYCNR